MDCCNVNGLNGMFDEKYARRNVADYRKKGLGNRGRKIVDFLEGNGLAGATLLEIGSGIGALHLELLKAGAARAVAVDVSSAYLAAGKDLAASLGYQDAVVHHQGDFVEMAKDIDSADIVIADRVVCCFPDMTGLVTSSASHARRFYALTFPRGFRWVHALLAPPLNALLALIKGDFRVFLHPPEKIKGTVRAAGFSEVFHSFDGPWEIVVFQRTA